MTREELLKSKEYWLTEIQMNLYEIIENYLRENNLTRNQFAEKLGVTKGYVSQILNGDFDHRLSKFIELSMAVGKVPRVDFIDIKEILKLDELGELHKKRYESINIELKIDPNIGITPPNLTTLDVEKEFKPIITKYPNNFMDCIYDPNPEEKFEII